MYIGFQIFLGILFAVTFAATVSLQGNMTDVDPTSYWNLAYWDRATSTGYGYLEFYYEDAACKAMKDVCWQAFEARKTNATAWDSLSVCSGCSQWTDNNDLASVKNFLSAPYSRQHSLFLQWLGATLALSAMALLIGATLHLLPLRPPVCGYSRYASGSSSHSLCTAVSAVHGQAVAVHKLCGS